MKVIVIGSTGTIGSAVTTALRARGDEVVEVSRKGAVAADIDDPASLHAMFERVGKVDAIVSCAGNGVFKPLAQLTDQDFAYSIKSKLMGQVNVVRLGQANVNDGGALVLTTGVLAHRPSPGTAALAMVNAGLEAFVKASALELPRGLRVGAVSPPWVKETLTKLGMDPAPGIAASELADYYLRLLDGKQTGETLHAW